MEMVGIPPLFAKAEPESVSPALLAARRFWEKTQLSEESIQARIKFLGFRRELGPTAAAHFNNSAELFELSRQKLRFAGPAFLEAIIGVEGTLRRYYAAPGTQISEEPFQNLFRRCSEIEELADEVFKRPTVFGKDFAPFLEKASQRHAAQLAEVVPGLRNQYVHGEPLLCHEFFFLAIDLRVVADFLTARKAREVKEASRV